MRASESAVVVKANLQLAQEMLETARRIAGDGEASLPLLQEQLRMMGEEVAAQRERIAELQQREFNDGQPTTADDHTKPAPVVAAAPARTSLDDREQQIERLRRVQDGIGAEINSLLTHTCGADVAVSLLTPAGARPLSDEQLRVLGEGIFASQLGRRDLREVPPQPELAAALMAAASELLTSGEATVAINDPGLLARISSLTSAIFDSWFRLGPRARFDAAELSPQVTMLRPTRCLTRCCPMS